MKKFIGIIITILIVALIATIAYYFFRNKPIVMPPDEARIKLLEKQIEDNVKQIFDLKMQRDSLLKANSQVDVQIVYLTAGIDSSIAKDSTNAIPEYRQAMTLFNWLPDNSRTLTFREIGIGAKIITEGYGMKLKIKNYEKTILADQRIFDKYENQLGNYKQIVLLKDSSIDYWHNEFKKTQRFWYDRFAVVAGPGFGYGENKFYPSFGITVGIKLWGTK